MAAEAQFYSTPAFELFRRGLNVQAIQRFHGINAYKSVAELGPDWARDCQNVLVPGWGGLSKFRLPTAMSTLVGAFGSGPQSFFDFQQANGTRQVVANFQTSLYYFPWNADGATLGAAVLIAGPSGADAGPWQFVQANNILFGVNGQIAMKWTGVAFQNTGIISPGIPAVINVAGAITATQGGWSWRAAFKNSVTGTVGAAINLSATTGNVGPNGFQVTVADPGPPDSQIDTVMWFRTLDGGGNWYRVAEINIVTGVVTFNAGTVSSAKAAGSNFFLQMTDNTPDTGLDKLTQAPLLNFPPIAGGKYQVVGQSRVFIANLPGAPQDIIYSGYEQILVGRPEESFPPGNRLRLSIGAEAINGIGVMQSGVVAFSGTKRLYALRGQVEDISVAAPVQFSAYLEELPYDIGTLSAQSIQTTSYGIIFWATDRTVQLIDQSFNLKNISKNVYPILRRATKGREATASSAYFNWLERDWYGLSFPIDGSVSNSFILFWSLDDDTGQIETFPCTIQADFMGTLSTPSFQRILAIAQAGLIRNLPVSQDTAGGISDGTIPATNNNLASFWNGGYFGNDTPFQSRMWRRGLLVSDQGGFRVTMRFANNITSQISQPNTLFTKGPKNLTRPTFGINRRANRMSVEIDFPQKDVSVNVLELHVGYITTSYRV